MFTYTRKELISGTPENPVYKEFKDTLNLSKVIRTVSLEDDRILVLMDDIHSRPQEVPVKNKAGKITSYKREMNIFQSEIYLDKEDAERFYKLMES